MSPFSAWIGFASKIEGKVATFLARVSRACAANPCRTIALFLIVCFACGSGWMLVDPLTDTEKLWVDLNSETHDNKEAVEEFFPQRSRYLRILAGVDTTGTNPDTNNLLSMVMVANLFKIHASVIEMKSVVKDVNGKVLGTFTINELCARRFSGDCDFSGVLKFWDFNQTYFEQTVQSDADVAFVVGQDRFITGEPANTAEYADLEITRDINGTAVAVTAAAAFVNWPLTAEFKVEGSSNTEVAQRQWESDFSELAATFDFKYEGLEVSFDTSETLDIELESTVFSDIHLIVVSYAAMIIFASLSLGKAFSVVKGRVLLASADVFVILISVFAAYGLALAAEIPFTTIAQLLPLILLGIGIDDAYVVSSAFDRVTITNPDKSVEDRMYMAIHRSGLSITVTSLTDIMAFLLGSLTKLPAITYFCLYAAFAIIFIYTAHLTIFPALLALDDKRRRANRIDMAPCITFGRRNIDGNGFTGERNSKVELSALPGTFPEEESASKSNNNSDKLTEIEIAQMSPFGRLLATKYAPVLLNNWCRGLVLLCYLSFTGFSLYMATLITTEFALQDLTTDGSDAFHHFQMQADFYGRGGIPGGLPVALYFGAVDYEDPLAQIELERTTRDFENGTWVDGDVAVFSWHRAFTSWAAQAMPMNLTEVIADDGEAFWFVTDDQFAPALRTFLDTRFGLFFGNNVVWSGDESDLTKDKDEEVIFSRVLGFHVTLPSALNSVDALEEGEAVADASDVEPQPFVFSSPYPFFDQYRIIVPEMVTSLGFTLVAVTIICSFILVHPLSVIILVVLLATIFVDLLGSLPLWEIDLNSISSVNLIMSIGLVVDFSAHIIHFFGLQDPSLSRKKRVMLTLGEIGPSVSLGCFTTFLGVLPLALAKSAVFRVFLKMFISIVAIGGTHGLVVLPVILSFIGPSLVRKNEQEVAEKEVESIHEQEDRASLTRGPEYAPSF